MHALHNYQKVQFFSMASRWCLELSCSKLFCRLCLQECVCVWDVTSLWQRVHDLWVMVCVCVRAADRQTDTQLSCHQSRVKWWNDAFLKDSRPVWSYFSSSTCQHPAQLLTYTHTHTHTEWPSSLLPVLFRLLQQSWLTVSGYRYTKSTQTPISSWVHPVSVCQRRPCEVSQRRKQEPRVSVWSECSNFSSNFHHPTNTLVSQWWLTRCWFVWGLEKKV